MTQSDAPNESREEKVRCPTCNGSGQDTGYKRVLCKTCDGDGEIPKDQQEYETHESELDLTYKHWNKAVEENKELRDQLSKEREKNAKLKLLNNITNTKLEVEREMRKELVQWMEGFKKLEPIITYPDNVPPEHEGEMIALSNALYKMKHLIAKASELDKTLKT